VSNGINGKTALIAQVQQLANQVVELERVLTSTKLDASLISLVNRTFLNRIPALKQDLATLLEDASGTLPIEEVWSGLRGKEQEVRPLFREGLAVVEGSLARSSGVDGGLCRLADSLLNQLSDKADVPWDRFTILAEGEFYADLVDIIRLRFPETSLWNLPVAAHEFGHYVAERLTAPDSHAGRRFPVLELIHRLSAGDSKEAYFLHEYFADVFATFASGPAYACTCLLLRFSPLGAHLDHDRHPSRLRRARLILDALERMSTQYDSFLPPYGDLIRRLQTAWAEMLGAEPSAHLDETRAAVLEGTLDELYSVLERSINNARYTGWDRALRLAGRLTPDHESPPQLGDEDDLRDVVNAAWLSRLRVGMDNRYAVRAITERAMALSQAVVAARVRGR
jgi:hypothetical protein